MNIWIRIYPVIQPEDVDNEPRPTHKLTLSFTPCLYASVYRTEPQAREAARHYGGVVFQTTEQFISDYVKDKELYIQGANESEYVANEPVKPTAVDIVIVADSDEDREWLDDLARKIHEKEKAGAQLCYKRGV